MRQTFCSQRDHRAVDAVTGWPAHPPAFFDGCHPMAMRTRKLLMKRTDQQRSDSSLAHAQPHSCQNGKKFCSCYYFPTTSSLGKMSLSTLLSQIPGEALRDAHLPPGALPLCCTGPPPEDPTSVHPQGGGEGAAAARPHQRQPETRLWLRTNAIRQSLRE